MPRKFHSAYDAAEYAATLTNAWMSEADERLDAEALLAMMSVADEEGEIDEENEDCYYIVTEDGAVGGTTDGGQLITWFAKPIGAPAAAPAAPAASAGPKFCTQCGAPLEADAKFCVSCGTPVPGAAQPQPQPVTPQPQPMAAPAPGAQPASTDRPHGGVGYSPVIRDPRFLQAVRKHRKSNRGCASVVILAPLVIMTLYGIFSKELGLIYGLFLGAVVSAVFFLIYFLATLKEKSQKPWEGTVTEKYEKTVRRRNKHTHDSTSGSDYYDEPHGIIVVRGDDGKIHKIDERLDTSWACSYSYMKVGERIRYHGQMGLPYPYEKYDKTRDEYVICAFCHKRTTIAQADCTHCHEPILR